MSVTCYNTEKGSFKVYPAYIEKFNVKKGIWEKFQGNHFDMFDHRPFGSSFQAMKQTSAFLERSPFSSGGIQRPSESALVHFKPALPPMIIKPMQNPASSLLLRILSLASRIR